jgi:hypothetical protein
MDIDKNVKTVLQYPVVQEDRGDLVRPLPTTL